MYDFAYKIVIIHGSTKYAFLKDQNGLSTDNTKIIIEEFPDEKNKIIYSEGLFPSKVEMRNAYLKLVPNDTDCILVLDGDEVYPTVNLNEISSYFSFDKNLVHMFNEQNWFWGDFNHICVIDTEIEKERHRDEPFFLDRYNHESFHGQYYERIFRFMPGMFYDKSHSLISDPEGKLLYFDEIYRKNRVHLDLERFRRYHYGYIKNLSNLCARFSYYALRDKKVDEGDKDGILKAVLSEYYITYLLGGRNALTKANPAFRVVPFEGIHPDIMLSHPYMDESPIKNTTREDIIKYLGQSPGGKRC